MGRNILDPWNTRNVFVVRVTSQLLMICISSHHSFCSQDVDKWPTGREMLIQIKYLYFKFTSFWTS